MKITSLIIKKNSNSQRKFSGIQDQDWLAIENFKLEDYQKL